MRNSTFLIKTLLFFTVLISLQFTTIPTAEGSVKFVEIEVNQVGEDVLIRWVTESEFNSQAFKIQRASDGSSDWEDIGVVDSNGNTPGAGTYELKDVNPLTGLAFYRIKQMDFDGTVTYSDKISIEVEFFTDPADPEIELYPNPSDEAVNITSNTSFSELVTVELTDISGKLIPVYLDINDRVINVQPTSKLSGLYFVLIKDRNITTVKKIKFVL